MANVLLPLDTAFLLKTDPARAYAVAALAAAQNNVEVVQAFLDDGLDPANAQHKSSTRGGGRDFHHCVWLAAVQNEAVETMSAIVEGLDKAQIRRLMGAKPMGWGSWQTALWEYAQKSIEFFLSRGYALGSKGREIWDFPYTAPAFACSALMGHENVAEAYAGDTRERLIFRGLTGDSFIAFPAHVYAAGDCARMLAKMIEADPECLKFGANVVSVASARRDLERLRRPYLLFPGVDRFAPNEDPSRLLPPGADADAPFDALDWALFSRAPNAVLALRDAMGRDTIEARAEWWLNWARKNEGAALHVHEMGVKVTSEERAAARDAFMAFCEGVVIGSATLAGTAEGGLAGGEGEGSEKATRRPVRL